MRFSQPEPVEETITDSEGAYEFNLPRPGPYQVEVQKEGYYARAEGPAELMVTPRLPEYELNFTLFPGASVLGTVRDAESNQAIPKVSVVLRSQETEQPAPWQRDVPLFRQQTESDAEGRFEFTSVAPGGYFLRAAKAPPEYALPERAEEVTVEEDEPLSHDLLLSPGLSISGQVLHPDGRKASGARVTGYPLGEGRTLSDESDPLGRYQLSTFPLDSEVRLLVRPLDFPELDPAPLLTERIRLEESLEEYELQVPRAGILPVQVLSDEDKPLRGQRVQLSYQPADPLEDWDDRLVDFFTKERSTGAEGRTEFNNLTPGPWKARVETLKDPVEVDFEAYSGENDPLTLVIPTESLVDNSGVLAGTVLFEDKSPAEGAWISARLQSDDQGIETGTQGSDRVDSEGNFRIARIRQAGEFQVSIRTRRSSQRIEGVVASNRELEFTIPNSGGLSVQVLDADRRPPASLWTATLFRSQGDGARFVFQQPEVSAAQGTAVWEELGQGTYQALIAGPEIPRAYSEMIEVESDQLTDGVEIRLPRPVNFSGEVIDADTGKGVPGVEVIEQFEPGTPGARWPQFQHQRRTFSDSLGDFLLMNLPPGPVRLLLKHPAYETQEHEAGEVPSGETRILLQKKLEEEQ